MSFPSQCFLFIKHYPYLCIQETLVIATYGIIKKTQKTPSKEIAKAEAIRKEYFKNK